MRSEIAQALWDMRKEMPRSDLDTEGIDTGQTEGRGREQLTATDVYERIRTEMADLQEQVRFLLQAYPDLEQASDYFVYKEQQKKLEKLTQNDETMRDRYEVVDATLASVKRQAQSLMEKAALRDMGEEHDAERLQQNKHTSETDPDGLFAWGESTHALEKVEYHLDTLLEENDALQDTPEYKQLSELAKRLRSGETSAETIAEAEAALLELRRMNVALKIEQLRKAASESVGEYTDPSNMLQAQQRWEEVAPQTHTIKEGESEDVTLRLLGLRVPQAGPQGVYGARSFRDALRLAADRALGLQEDPEKQSKFGRILSLLDAVPDSGLTQEQVSEIARLAQEINLPESVIRQKFSSIDEMYAEVERKVAEKLSGLEEKEKKGGRKFFMLLGAAVLAALPSMLNKEDTAPSTSANATSSSSTQAQGTPSPTASLNTTATARAVQGEFEGPAFPPPPEDTEYGSDVQMPAGDKAHPTEKPETRVAPEAPSDIAFVDTTPDVETELERLYTVQKGDNLWNYAEGDLDGVSMSPVLQKIPKERRNEVLKFVRAELIADAGWREKVGIKKHPDLIYPGETLNAAQLDALITKVAQDHHIAIGK